MRKNGEECSQTCSPWFDECGKKQNARSCGSTLCGKCCEFYGFRQCLDSGYGVVDLSCMREGVDECVIQVVVMVVSVRLVQGV